ncbi:glycosyl hydrolase [Actinacidiphila acididurans]|uniref:Glycosyl hydrolase n=1 Tax=Actinacidiphila acididurans TaxID=2784346 RepID=A0ABS2TY55_9ACTN|nr:glycosyl hydrolase [Actinacidiphila acididurans]MBM9508017.1 glycosyl hydrolase [Actinacidiphila acididurans]
MNDGPDFALDGLRPADIDSEQAMDSLWASDLQLIVEHHSPDGSRSYLVAHDTSVTWGTPGQPQLTAIMIARDVQRRTFVLQAGYHAELSFAQAWLIERGCPPDEAITYVGEFMEASDDLTRRVEQKIREAGQRYDVLESWTWDDAPCETWILARDTLAAQNPIRVFLKDADLDAFAYTVREGAFPDEDAAREWLNTRNGPLPPPPEDRGDTTALRTHAALTRSPGTAPLTTACGLDTLPPSPTTAQQPNPGRSL